MSSPTLPEEFYAWIGVDETGPHVIAAGILHRHFATPLVTTRLDLAQKMAPFAELHSRKTGEGVHLVKYTNPEVLRTYGARGGWTDGESRL